MKRQIKRCWNKQLVRVKKTHCWLVHAKAPLLAVLLIYLIFFIILFHVISIDCGRRTFQLLSIFALSGMLFREW